MKKKIIGILICMLLIATTIPLSLATNENEPKDSPWTISGFNSDISMSGTPDFTCYFWYRYNPLTKVCHSKLFLIRYGADGEITTSEGSHQGRFSMIVYRYNGFRERNETDHTSIFDGKAIFYYAREIG